MSLVENVSKFLWESKDKLKNLVHKQERNKSQKLSMFYLFKIAPQKAEIVMSLELKSYF